MSQTESTLERLKEKAAEEAKEEEEEVVEDDVDESSKSSLREYIIISGWKEQGRIEASSAKAALDSLGGEKNGDFAVIPSRNFSEFEAATETKSVTTITPK